MDHFVSSPREREKKEIRDSRRDEREGQGKKRKLCITVSCLVQILFFFFVQIISCLCFLVVYFYSISDTIENKTYLEAVKMAWELVAIELIGLKWALISASCEHVSICHNLRNPPRQPLNNMLAPCIKSRAHIQSLCAEFTDCNRKQNSS